jgi:hypothetical protein
VTTTDDLQHHQTAGTVLALGNTGAHPYLITAVGDCDTDHPHGYGCVGVVELRHAWHPHLTVSSVHVAGTDTLTVVTGPWPCRPRSSVLTLTDAHHRADTLMHGGGR